MTGQINTRIKYLAADGRIPGSALNRNAKALESDGAVVTVDRNGGVEIAFPETGESARTYLPIR